MSKKENRTRTGEPNISRRSEEVQDLIERMPTKWTFGVAIIVTVIIVITAVLSYIIKYPDTVSGMISITGQKAPVRIVSPVSGRLHLLIRNNENVKKGSCIGYIESGVQYEDMLELDRICSAIMTRNIIMHLPADLELGALSIYYNDFVLSYNQYDRLRTTKVYENMRKTLRNQRKSDIRVEKNLHQEIQLSNRILSNMQQQYSADSILYLSGVISAENLSTQHNSILAQQRSNIELKSTSLSKKSDINSADIELAKIDINVQEELASSYNAMASKYNILTNEIRRWKESYLFISPIDGKVEYLGFWRNNIFIPSSQELFSVSPVENKLIGELKMPSNGAGKVKAGQDVNIKLNDFPYEEYGYIRGKVESISTLTHTIEISGGTIDAYLVTVSFPKATTTNLGKKLPLNFESKGIGEIITKKRRLIQRLFDNLKSRENK